MKTIALCSLLLSGCALDDASTDDLDLSTNEQAVIAYCDPECDYPAPDGGYWTSPDYSTQAISTAAAPYGWVQLFPGQKACWGVIDADHNIRYEVDVIPNLGTPKAKVTIWKDQRANMNNAVAVFGGKRTGPDAVIYWDYAGFYQICAKYPVGQMVTGAWNDFMNVTVIANWD